MSLLAELGVEVPVLAAPMAGGPSTPRLVAAAAAAGSLGFLAGGYRTAAQLGDSIDEVRSSTDLFGVNLFAPGALVPVDPAVYRAHRERLLPLADRFGVELPEVLREDDDGWAAKVDLLVAAPVPVVSFTFGLPPTADLTRLRGTGVLLAATVTSVAEAREARGAGVDALVVQSVEAGGHWGTWHPRQATVTSPALPDLVAAIRSEVGLPVWAAGGVWRSEQTEQLLAAGAEAVQVGTALLRTPEAGTSATYRSVLAALAEDPDSLRRVTTTAFSGRPAGAVANPFTDLFGQDAPLGQGAPLGYPALHHLTSPIRRAAAAAGDGDWINVWGGPGAAHTSPRPVAEVLRSIAG